jgi:hypothetical protein
MVTGQLHAIMQTLAIAAQRSTDSRNIKKIPANTPKPPGRQPRTSGVSAHRPLVPCCRDNGRFHYARTGGDLTKIIARADGRTDVLSPLLQPLHGTGDPG